MISKEKKQFVGREDEQELFASMLDGKCMKWIIYIPGDGGMGKSHLLQKMCEHAIAVARKTHKVVVTKKLVDFFDASNRTIHGLLYNIATQLGIGHFPSFNEKQHGHLEYEEAASDATRGLLTAFLTDYRALLSKGYRVVLLFDTCEEIHSKPWVTTVFLPRLAQVEREVYAETHPNEDLNYPFPFRTTAIFAGRDKPKMLEFAPSLQDAVYIMRLQSITGSDWKKYFSQYWLPSEATEADNVKKLHDRSAGRPLYMALIYDYLMAGVGSVQTLLAHDVALRKELAEWIRRLDKVEFRAILLSALAWRRVEPSLLAKLLGTSVAEAKEIIKRLEKYSFTKYRPPRGDFPGSFQLQDEFRDLVLQYVWPSEGIRMQRFYYKRIVEWYEDRIGNPDLLDGTVSPRTDEHSALLAEWIFYHCNLNLSHGVKLAKPLFEMAVHRLYLEFSELLIEELRRPAFRENYSRAEGDLLEFQTALLDHRQEKFEEAKATWVAFRYRPNLGCELQAGARVMLTELLASSEPDEAIELARETEALLQKWIDESPSDVDMRKKLGSVYNNWGYAYRVLGRWDQALKYYFESLKVQELGKKQRARTLNNIGFVYYNMGDMINARRYVLDGLNRRIEIGIPYELGLSYNTYGMICEDDDQFEEATENYDKALEQFVLAHSEYGKALVYVNKGRTHRTVRDFETSITLLTQAVDIFKQGDNAVYHIQALNELGCAYRESWKKEDNFEKAKEKLEMSRDLSKELGNRNLLADTLEDLSILYLMRAQESDDAQSGRDDGYAQQAEDLAQEACAIANDLELRDLCAKVTVTLGELAFRKKDYGDAFDQLYQACLLIIQARNDGKVIPPLLDKQFQKVSAKLQTYLLKLPDGNGNESSSRTFHARRLLDELAKHPAHETDKDLKNIGAVLHSVL